MVHFSQQQPAHDNYTTITMSSRSKPTTKSPQPTEPEEPSPTPSFNDENDTPSSVVSMTIEQRCEDAQNNIKTLKRTTIKTLKRTTIKSFHLLH